MTVKRVNVGNVVFGGCDLVMIAGPCVMFTMVASTPKLANVSTSFLP